MEEKDKKYIEIPSDRVCYVVGRGIALGGAL